LTRAEEPVYFATTATPSSRWAMFRDNEKKAMQSRGSWREWAPFGDRTGPPGPATAAGRGRVAGREWGVKIKEKDRAQIGEV